MDEGGLIGNGSTERDGEEKGSGWKEEGRRSTRARKGGGEKKRGGMEDVMVGRGKIEMMGRGKEVDGCGLG